MRAEEFSIDTNYWPEEEVASPSAAFQALLDAPSGRSAAAHLRAQRAAKA